MFSTRRCGRIADYVLRTKDATQPIGTFIIPNSLINADHTYLLITSTTNTLLPSPLILSPSSFPCTSILFTHEPTETYSQTWQGVHHLDLQRLGHYQPMYKRTLNPIQEPQLCFSSVEILYHAPYQPCMQRISWSLIPLKQRMKYVDIYLLRSACKTRC